jgi:putative restriction endonuclease
MHRSWWVNHNQTARQEIEGQYLWSPKRESGGAHSQFYDNMRRASPGDLVLSYFGQAVRYVGRATDFAFTAPKPEEFGQTGAYWSRDGWLLPVFWTPLSPPVRPKELIGEIGPLLPTRYSPIHPVTGAGNQKAYLAEIPEAVLSAVVRDVRFSQPALLQGGANSLNFASVSEMLDDAVERRLAADLSLEATVRESVIQARRGQGRFRRNVEKLERACPLTGVTNPALLIASHIKPWRACNSIEERLDGQNGLLLTPDADLLFDRGFISFRDEGAVLVSRRVDHEDLRRLGLKHIAWSQFEVSEAGLPWVQSVGRPERASYLAYHRSEVFIQ